MTAPEPYDLDAICEAFEAAWQAHDGYPDVESTVARWSDTSLAGEVARELALTDLEWRWRRRAPQEDPPRLARWYAEHLGISGKDLEMLVQHELIVRSRWGDRPTVYQIVAEAGGDDRLYRQLMTHLCRRYPVRGTIDRDGRRYYRFTLRGALEMGRQRSDEPMPPIQLPSRSDRPARLVFVPRSENAVSRRQLTIRRWAVDRIQLSTSGARAPLYCNGSILPAEYLREALLPVTIAIGPYTIRFEADG